MTPVLLEALQVHVSPRIALTMASSTERHYLTVGWGGYYVDKDVHEIYESILEGSLDAVQVMKALAAEFVVELARAIAKGHGDSLEPPATPESDAILEAELQANEDEGEIH